MNTLFENNMDMLQPDMYARWNDEVTAWDYGSTNVPYYNVYLLQTLHNTADTLIVEFNSVSIGNYYGISSKITFLKNKTSVKKYAPDLSPLFKADLPKYRKLLEDLAYKLPTDLMEEIMKNADMCKEYKALTKLREEI